MGKWEPVEVLIAETVAGAAAIAATGHNGYGWFLLFAAALIVVTSL